MFKQILIRLKTKRQERRMEEKKRQERLKELMQNDCYIVSEHANIDNILIDTCAISNNGLDIIRESKKVNVLYATVEEIEKVKTKLQGKKNKKSIHREQIRFLTNFSEYVLTNSRCKIILIDNKNKEYVDDIILRYLKHIPRIWRPTLLTADKILAVRAKGLGIEYIFIKNAPSNVGKNQKIKSNKSETKKTVNQNELQKNTKLETNQVQTTEKKEIVKTDDALGKVISYNGESVIVKNRCKQSKMFLVKGEECKELSLDVNNNINVPFDYLVVTMYVPKLKVVRIVKITINEEIIKDTYDCKFINEIYKLPIHEQVLEKAKNELSLTA